MQKRCNSGVLVIEINLLCIKPSICLLRFTLFFLHTFFMTWTNKLDEKSYQWLILPLSPRAVFSNLTLWCSLWCHTNVRHWHQGIPTVNIAFPLCVKSGDQAHNPSSSDSYALVLSLLQRYIYTSLVIVLNCCMFCPNCFSIQAVHNRHYSALSSMENKAA